MRLNFNDRCRCELNSYNLFIFIALREHVYLLYVLSTFGYLLLIGNINGTAFQLIWPGSPEIQNRAMLFTVPLAVIFTLLFSRSFLRLKQTGPVLNRVVLCFVALNAAMVVITGVMEYGSAIRLTVAMAIPSTLLLTVIGPLQWGRGNPQAGYYTIAWRAIPWQCDNSSQQIRMDPQQLRYHLRHGNWVCV